MRDFEAAQAEAMELLLQQCVDTATSDLQGVRCRWLCNKPRGSELAECSCEKLFFQELI